MWIFNDSVEEIGMDFEIRFWRTMMVLVPFKVAILVAALVCTTVTGFDVPTAVGIRRCAVSTTTCHCTPANVPVSARRSSSRCSTVQLWATNKQGTKAQSPNDDIAATVAWNFNAIPALAWLGIVAFAVSRPDSADLDATLIQSILDNPTNPGINELFLFLFNVFLPLPAILAALLVPQGSPGTTPPAGPFIAASFGLGYFALGPYLVVRPPPRRVIDNAEESSISWVTRQVLENKVCGWSLLAVLLYLPWAAQLPQAWSVDSGVSVWSDFVDLFASSRLVAVSCVDLTLLHLTAAALIPADYRLRTSSTDKDEEDRGRLVALAAALLPFVGPAVYVALRPKLVVLQDETI
jgi:hypothetical protein